MLLSSTSVNKRGYVQAEYKLALDMLKKIPENEIYVIPLRLDDCEIPPSFRKYHVVDLFPNLEKLLDKIINKILKANSSF